MLALFEVAIVTIPVVLLSEDLGEEEVASRCALSY